ncbi:N-acetyltransferase [Virgibacillus phasianinus]|uniref:N-acetyltransferase n=1 Tax=Virgibacillus phasianinus TaxID=2017483 RepID=A0A220U6M8_9BACI|nr:GNAT family N-acetyltransferase [Virgibacillus phasianinus]ASK63779.1 N-acetyltransferase [Virgibacillus phasianinus]
MSATIAIDKLHNGQTFYVRYLSINDLPLIMQLQEKVKHALSSPATLEPLSEEEFKIILSGHQLMIGVFLEERMIAFRAMLEPEIDNEHLGIDAGLPPEELPKVLYSEISNVDPEYRGNGLQTYMGKLLMERLDKKRFQYVCATVAPFNIPSLKDKLLLGMKIVALKEKYSGKLRYVLMNSLSETDKDSCKDKITISMNDSNAQQKCLKSGFQGSSIKQKNNDWYVVFSK